MLYLAVNKNGEFRLFDYFFPPYKTSVPVFITCDGEDDYDEDFYGNFRRKKIPTGEVREIWVISTTEESRREGIKIDKQFLSQELQKMTWEDEPKKLSNE